jgi:hypothetical protein
MRKMNVKNFKQFVNESTNKKYYHTVHLEEILMIL